MVGQGRRDDALVCFFIAIYFLCCFVVFVHMFLWNMSEFSAVYSEIRH